jgi:hypothetical protein
VPLWPGLHCQKPTSNHLTHGKVKGRTAGQEILCQLWHQELYYRVHYKWCVSLRCCPISLRSILLLLSYHLHFLPPSRLFLPVLPIKIVLEFLILPMRGGYSICITSLHSDTDAD